MGLKPDVFERRFGLARLAEANHCVPHILQDLTAERNAELSKGGRNMADLTNEVETHDAATESSVPTVDMKFEIVVIPVSDVDRAKEFYTRLG